MERGALKGHGALLLANVIWGLNSPICKTVLLSPENPEGLNHFALTVYRLVGAFLLFWLASAFLPRERVAWRDLGGLFVASLFGIQLDQILFLWGLSLTSPINVSIIATTVPILTMILAMFFLREPMHFTLPTDTTAVQPQPWWVRRKPDRIPIIAETRSTTTSWQSVSPPTS